MLGNKTEGETDIPDKSSSNIVSCCCKSAPDVSVSELSLSPGVRVLRDIGGVGTMLYLDLLPDDDVSLGFRPARRAVFSSVRLANPLYKGHQQLSD